MAKSADYIHSSEFEDLDEFTVQATQIFREDGPIPVSVKTVPNARLPDTRAPSTGPTEPTLPHVQEAIATLIRELSG